MIALLLGLKLRLMVRAFTRRGGVRTVLMFTLVALAMAPIWMGLTTISYIGATKYGGLAVAVGFGLIHLAWLGTSLLFGSYAEGFDLRLLLRYPINPRTAFWLNVIVAPVDMSAIFLLPPLLALVWASATRSGALAAGLVALASVLMLLITGAGVQALIALLGRYLRKEWTRALIGLFVGFAFLIPAMFLRGSGSGKAGRGALFDLAREGMTTMASFFAYFPTTAFPVRAARAAVEGHFLPALLFLVAGGVFLILMVRVCSSIALSEALNRHTGSAEHGSKSNTTGTRDRSLESRLEAVMPLDLAMLVGRDLRTFARTPQVLLGLLTALPIVLLMSRSLQHQTGSDVLPFMMAFAALLTALSIASNQFGLDQAGVRLLFLLPVSGQRVIVAKNIACSIVSGIAFLVCTIASAALGRLSPIHAVASFVTLAAALPVVLSFGNRLSIRHPWRMTFRLGGAPPGAMMSGLAQIAALAGVGLLLTPGLFVLPMVYGDRVWVQAASLWITGVIAAGLWTVWYLLLPRAARTLDARRESIIDRLAHANETG